MESLLAKKLLLASKPVAILLRNENRREPHNFSREAGVA